MRIRKNSLMVLVVFATSVEQIAAGAESKPYLIRLQEIASDVDLWLTQTDLSGADLQKYREFKELNPSATVDAWKRSQAWARGEWKGYEPARLTREAREPWAHEKEEFERFKRGGGSLSTFRETKANEAKHALYAKNAEMLKEDKRLRKQNAAIEASRAYRLSEQMNEHKYGRIAERQEADRPEREAEEYADMGQKLELSEMEIKEQVEREKREREALIARRARQEADRLEQERQQAERARIEREAELAAVEQAREIERGYNASLQENAIKPVDESMLGAQQEFYNRLDERQSQLAQEQRAENVARKKELFKVIEQHRAALEQEGLVNKEVQEEYHRDRMAREDRIAAADRLQQEERKQEQERQQAERVRIEREAELAAVEQAREIERDYNASLQENAIKPVDESMLGAQQEFYNRLDESQSRLAQEQKAENAEKAERIARGVERRKALAHELSRGEALEHEQHEANQARDAALRGLDGLAGLVDKEHRRLMELGFLGRARELLNRTAQQIKQEYERVDKSLEQRVEDSFDKQPDPVKARAESQERKKKVREWKDKVIQAGDEVKKMLDIKSKL